MKNFLYKLLAMFIEAIIIGCGAGVSLFLLEKLFQGRCHDD